jgi:hypothetical protein
MVAPPTHSRQRSICHLPILERRLSPGMASTRHEGRPSSATVGSIPARALPNWIKVKNPQHAAMTRVMMSERRSRIARRRQAITPT